MADGRTDPDEQRRQWEAWVAEQRAKGLCEFSGLPVTQCQATICDCFETPEGALKIEVDSGAWFPFGTHVEVPIPLEFKDEDEGGLPTWERPLTTQQEA